MFIDLHIREKDGSFIQIPLNMNLVFAMQRDRGITVLTTTAGLFNPGVKETPEEIMQLIKEASK